MVRPDILYWCMFAISIGSVHMQKASVDIVGLNFTSSQSESDVSVSSPQNNQPAEIASLFGTTPNRKNITISLSTESYPDLPIMEGGGPIEKGMLPFNGSKSTTVRGDVIKGHENDTDQSHSVVTSPNIDKSSVHNNGGAPLEIGKELSKVPSSTPKIYPRKGVSFNPEPTSVTSVSPIISTPMENILINSATKINNFIKSSNGSTNITTMHVSTNVSTEKVTSNSSAINSTVINKPSSANNSRTNDDIISNPPLKRKKPLLTTDTSTDDIEASVIRSRKPSPQRDYVIPVVVTILTVPMIVVLGMYFYKKGHECWERRHYRRMDFLIDGMYND